MLKSITIRFIAGTINQFNPYYNLNSLDEMVETANKRSKLNTKNIIIIILYLVNKNQSDIQVFCPEFFLPDI